MFNKIKEVLGNKKSDTDVKSDGVKPVRVAKTKSVEKKTITKSRNPIKEKKC